MEEEKNYKRFFGSVIEMALEAAQKRLTAELIVALATQQWFKAAAITAGLVAVGAGKEWVGTWGVGESDSGTLTSGTETGGGATEYRGTTISAREMNVTIAPRVTIRGEHVFIGDTGVAERNIADMCVRTIKDALEVGEISVEKEIR